MKQLEADYVIVGAGSAGCALAYRLSENPANTVVLLEAGGWDWNPWIHIPLGWPRILMKRMNDWMYFSEDEKEIGGRLIECARGRVVGGSSSINAMGYVRGHSGDYDRWASLGLSDWSYERVLPYFRRQETWEGGEDRYRGGSGPLNTQFSRYDDPLREVFTTAGLCAGYTYTSDYNGAEQEGFGEFQATIKDGRRCSTAVAYLRPALRRKNLRLLIKSVARKLILQGPRAVGVEFEKNGEVSVVRASKEVICCGGVINSPQLLNLSGIGDPSDLKELGIDTSIALRGVGKNLQDHISVAVSYRRKYSGPLHNQMRVDRIAAQLGNAYFRGAGIATDLPSGGMAFLRSSPDVDLPDIQMIPVAAPMTAAPYLRPFREPYVDGFALRAILLRPESRGTVKLASANPLDAPVIRQNFLTAGNDRHLLRKGLRMARDIGRQGPMSRFVERELAPHGYSDEEIDGHIDATGISVHHPCGTCKMGLENDPMAVVDAELRVFGVDGLRVVDASVMPDLIGGNINATAIMIAEKAADLINRSPVR
ncbi:MULTISPECIES: GMC family oxidoreductase [Neorhizobium]|uniref:GMC family oxidoreductase n=1 Tax=Neorhizobium TaxID=1525371 RepID=UPI000CF95FB6|nr:MULTISPECIES: GMC family oxidoreductase N-terminal domain-containing protein [Neorhizobium]